MVEFDFVSVEDRAAVHEYGPLSLWAHKELPRVPKADGGLLAGNLRSWTLQAQVHVDRLLRSASTQGDLLKTELLRMLVDTQIT